jgi:hypothetical protein
MPPGASAPAPRVQRARQRADDRRGQNDVGDPRTWRSPLMRFAQPVCCAPHKRRGLGFAINFGKRLQRRALATLQSTIKNGKRWVVEAGACASRAALAQRTLVATAGAEGGSDPIGLSLPDGAHSRRQAGAGGPGDLATISTPRAVLNGRCNSSTTTTRQRGERARNLCADGHR